MITDEDWVHWLRTDHRRIILVESSYMTDDGPQPVYVSYGGYVSGASDTPASTPYDDVVLAVPDWSVGVDRTMGRGTVTIANPDARYDDWIDRPFDGQPIRILLGDPSWPRADFRPIMAGIVDHVSGADANTITLDIRDASEALNKEIQTRLLPSGDPWPLTFGLPVHFAPVPIDPTARTYAFQDGTMANPSWTIAPLNNGYPMSGQVSTISMTLGTMTMAGYYNGAVTAQWTTGTAMARTHVLDVIEDVALRGGLTSSQIDSASMSAVRSMMSQAASTLWPEMIHPYAVGVYVTSRANTLGLIRDIAESCGLWVYFDRVGRLSVAWDAPPQITSTVSLELSTDDIVQGGIVPADWHAPLLKATVKGGRNWAVLAKESLAAAIDPAQKELLAKDYWYTSGVDSLSPLHLGAESPPPRETHLATQGAVDAEARRWMYTRSMPRRVYQVTTLLPSVPARPGDRIRVTYPRYGFGSGRTCTLVGITEDPIAGRSVMEVMV